MSAIYPRLFAKLFRAPLMLHPPVRQTFEAAILPRIMGQASDAPAHPRAAEDGASIPARRVYSKLGKVAMISINGVIDKRVSDFDLDCYGGVDLADVDDALAAAGEDASVEKVALLINSPGGSVVGVPETAARIAALREHKEIRAFVDVMACSAGYYLASQADAITAAPSAIIGSIGVYMAVLDATRAMEMEGVRVQMVKSGRFKAMGSPWNPLTEEERGMLQESCDRCYSAFTAAVTSQRPRVSTETMQGQWFDGEQAEDLYLVDELSNETEDEFISRLLLTS